LVVPFDCSKVSASRAGTGWTCAPPFVMKIFAVDEVAVAFPDRLMTMLRRRPAWGSVRSIDPCSSPDTKRGR
jgi:hypothetical protein